jgi:glycosyltransferase involved in cell wall biosynthesis
LIAGEWENRKDKSIVNKFIRENNLINKIEFLGLIHDKDKWSFYRQLDFFVLPSFNEGQPLVLIEAMGFGIPILCSNVGAIPDTIKSGYNGFIVENFRAKDYLLHIQELIKNKKYYSEISLNNLNTFRKRFLIENYFKKIHSWIDINSNKK